MCIKCNIFFNLQITFDWANGFFKIMYQWNHIVKTHSYNMFEMFVFLKSIISKKFKCQCVTSKFKSWRNWRQKFKQANPTLFSSSRSIMWLCLICRILESPPQKSHSTILRRLPLVQIYFKTRLIFKYYVSK